MPLDKTVSNFYTIIGRLLPSSQINNAIKVPEHCSHMSRRTLKALESFNQYLNNSSLICIVLVISLIGQARLVPRWSIRLDIICQKYFEKNEDRIAGVVIPTNPVSCSRIDSTSPIGL